MTPPEDALSTREVQLLTTAKLADIEKKTDSGIRQNTEILKVLTEVQLQMALGNRRHDGNEKRLDLIEGDKRSTAAMITSGVAIVSGLGTLLFEVIFGKHVP